MVRGQDRGATSVEYALIVSIVAVIAAAVFTLGQTVIGLFQAAADGFP